MTAWRTGTGDRDRGHHPSPDHPARPGRRGHQPDPAPRRPEPPRPAAPRRSSTRPCPATWPPKNPTRTTRRHYVVRGWPVANGAIEGACLHLVQDRLGITGAPGAARRRGGLAATRHPRQPRPGLPLDPPRRPRTPAQPPQPLTATASRSPHERSLPVNTLHPHMCPADALHLREAELDQARSPLPGPGVELHDA